jgi:hypothetical protein
MKTKPKDPRKSVYVAGKMTGLVDFNFPKFFAAEKVLKAEGWLVVNPAAHDLETGMVETFYPFLRREYGGTLHYRSTDKFDLKTVLLWDLDQVAKCDAIFLLDGWEDSKGANAELALAKALGKEVLYQSPEPAPALLDAAEKLGVSESERPEWVTVVGNLTGETRVISGTGGVKGKKTVQVSALDPVALKRVAEVAGFGAGKYERLNYLRGFDWSLAYDALFRHALDALNGQDYDEESGLLNLAHAAWQCLALISFFERGLGTDDRYTSTEMAGLQTKEVRA